MKNFIPNKLTKEMVIDLLFKRIENLRQANIELMENNEIRNQNIVAYQFLINLVNRLELENQELNEVVSYIKQRLLPQMEELCKENENLINENIVLKLEKAILKPDKK